MEFKCRTCGEIKPQLEFDIDKRTKTGYSKDCLECEIKNKPYAKIQREEIKEEIKEEIQEEVKNQENIVLNKEEIIAPEKAESIEPWYVKFWKNLFVKDIKCKQ